MDAHTLALGKMQSVGANITTIRLMDPTDYQIRNLVRDWEESEKRKNNSYRVDPTQVKVRKNELRWNQATLISILMFFSYT